MKPNDLATTKLSKNEAKILCYLLDNKQDIRSRQLERKLELRQPEVSVTLKGFHNRGWIKYTKIKPNGKGRPEHNYYLAKPSEDIIGALIADLETERESLSNSITLLSEMRKNL